MEFKKGMLYQNKFNIEQAQKEDITNYKSIIFKLDRKQKRERNFEKRRKINIELKGKLKKALEIMPNDLELQIELMYTYINLRELENARNIGNKLLENSNSKALLNGLALIEEKSGNYEKSIEYIEKILEKEPNNQVLKERLEILRHKKENLPIDKEMIEKREAYKKIASLERNIIKYMEKQQEELERQGIKSNRDMILQRSYENTYLEVRKIAESIIAKHPEEIVAREKLIKALYILKKEDEARKEIGDLLNIYDKDEIGLWYLAKIQRNNGDLEGEKETLEKILKDSEEGTHIKAQQRLEKVKKLICEKQKRQELEKAKESTYTEEGRQEFLESVKQEFLYGKINKNNIDLKIEEARKYPNFDKSLIELLDIKAMITGDREQKIQGLDRYIDTESSITAENYGRVLDEISRTRENIEDDKRIEAYLDQKEKEEKDKRKEKAKEQRDYFKKIIERLNKGEISKEELPKIISKLETFEDASKSVFLITKLYEILYDRNEAYKVLAKYSSILNLSEGQRKELVNLQERLTSKEKDTGATKKIKAIYGKKARKEQRYNKKIQTETIKKYLDDGKTVKQIFNMLKNKAVSLKSIAKIKSTYIKGNKEKQEEYFKLQDNARNLIKSGYKPEDVYEMLEYDIPLIKIREMANELKREEIEK